MSALELFSLYDTPKNMNEIITIKDDTPFKELLEEHVCLGEYNNKGTTYYLWKAKDTLFIQIINESNPLFFIEVDDNIDNEFKFYNEHNPLPTLKDLTPIEYVKIKETHALDYITPEINDKFRCKSYYGGISNSLEELEENFLKNPLIFEGGCFISSSSPKYTHGFPPKSVAYSKYSHSIIEVLHLIEMKDNDNKAPILINIYYKTSNIPVDIKALISKSKLIEVSNYVDIVTSKFSKILDDEAIQMHKLSLLLLEYSKYEEKQKNEIYNNILALYSSEDELFEKLSNKKNILENNTITIDEDSALEDI
jgi:hypothetical protein